MRNLTGFPPQPILKQEEAVVLDLIMSIKKYSFNKLRFFLRVCDMTYQVINVNFLLCANYMYHIR